MAFFMSSMDVGLTPPLEYREVKADETVVLGEALTVTGGLLTKCAATKRPSYIAAGPKNAAGVAPVIRVQCFQIWEAPLSADGAALKVGEKVTLEADGLQVTATTTGGVAEIVQILGTAIGDPVRVKF